MAAKKNGLAETVVVLAIIMGAILTATYLLNKESQKPIACTADARLCPDGTYVGRIAPDCRFAPCPSCLCPLGYVQDGDVCNPGCYYSNPMCLSPSIPCENSS